ncbi:MAG: hypothetical protein AAB926_01480 [Patescibacteria group bacterium]
MIWPKDIEWWHWLIIGVFFLFVISPLFKETIKRLAENDFGENNGNNGG